jgi:hypothetical protein
VTNGLYFFKKLEVCWVIKRSLALYLWVKLEVGGIIDEVGGIPLKTGGIMPEIGGILPQTGGINQHFGGIHTRERQIFHKKKQTNCLNSVRTSFNGI